MKHCPTCDCERQLEALRAQLKDYQDGLARDSAKIVILEAQIRELEYPDAVVAP